MISSFNFHSTFTRIIRLLCGAAFAANLATPAQAQEESDALDEVVVTATRQVSTVNKVPMSITAVTPEQLERQRVNDVQDLARIVPGVTFRRDSGDGNPDIAIRGIKSFSQGTPTTGIFIDDVPIHKRGSSGGVSGNGSPFPPLYDLARVEVLRGPQGTLYGGSAQGGAIRFITPTPSLTDFEMKARGELSQVDHGGSGYDASIAAGGPIIADKLGIRASALYRRQGGYIDHVSIYTGERFADNANWRESKAARLSMLWKATDTLTFTPSFYYSEEHLNDNELFNDDIPQLTINGGLFTNRGATPGGTTGGVLFDFPDTAYAGGVLPATNFLGRGRTFMGIYPDTTSTPSFSGSPRDTELSLPALTVDFDMGAVSLKSITAYVTDTVSGYTPGVTQMLGTFPGVMPNATNPQYVIPGSVATTCGNTSSITDDGICRVPVAGGAGTNFIIPGFPLRIARSEYFNERRAFSQELRFQSNAEDSKFNWIAGAFFSNAHYEQNLENVGNDQDVSMFLRGVGFEWFLGAPAADPVTGQLLPVGAPGLSTYRHQYTQEKDIAVFGEISYEFTSKWKGTLGLRASESDLDYYQVSAGGNLVGNPPGFVATPQPPTRITDPTVGHPFANQPGDPINTTSGSQTEHPLTPKAGIQYQASDNQLFYGTISTGFRAGGINIPASQGNCGAALAALGWTTTPEEYASDELTSYELGAKNRLGNWQINSSVFYIDWKDPQINQRLSACLFNYLDNGGAAVSQGFDVQVSGRLGPVSINGSAAYTDATYTETVYSQVAPGATPQVIVREGDTMGVPKWQFGASMQYDFSLADTPGYLRADYQYSGDYLRTTGPGTISYDPFGYYGESFQDLSLRVGMNFDSMEVSLFMTNVTNDDSLLSMARPSAASSLSFLTYQSQMRPREMGVTLSYRF